MIAARVDAWSRGRFLGAALPRSFLQHFGDTSLLLFEGGEPMGVLIGFRSQTSAHVACVHYVSVSPACRRRGLGGELFNRFFELAAAMGCTEVHSVASPASSSLIAFHRQIGFEVVDGGAFVHGIAVFPDFAGPGQHRVLLRKPVAVPERSRPASLDQPSQLAPVADSFDSSASSPGMLRSYAATRGPYP